MQHTAIDEGSSRRLLKLGVLAVIAAIVVSGGLLLRMKLAGGSGEQESYTPYTVGAMTLRAMVTSAGTSVAQNEAVLSFQKPGQLGEILVGLGDEVREGQPLMRLKTDDLENVAASAQSALTLAELQLQKLEEGSTDADISKANGAVATARAALTKAQNDLKVALDPATEARRTAAEQAVALAEANLAAAEAKLDALEEGASDAEYAAAEAAVTQAEAKLSQAQRGADDADSAIGDAQASFQTAAISYCDIVNGAGFECPNGSQTIPVQNICDAIETDHYETALNAGQVNAVSDCIDASATDATPQAETPTPTATALPISGIQLATTYLIYANTNYKTAITTANNAEDNVVIAQASLDAANAALDQLDEGASNKDIDAAQEGVVSAQAGLDAARAALQELVDGPTAEDVANLSVAVEKVQADLAAAEAARDDAIAGATDTELAMQQEQVHAAELHLQQANIALSDATLVSPFDGVVSALPLKIGQVVNAALPAITILTPGTLIFQLNVSETELASIKVGQQGSVMFDALPGKTYGVQVFAIGLSPETNQGVLIYKVKCKILDDTNVPGAANPAPGMNGTANVTTQLYENVVAVPSAVVRARGGQQVVELYGADDKIEIRPVTTGVTDGANIQILQGLAVGDTLAVRASAAAKVGSGTPLPGGIQ